MMITTSSYSCILSLARSSKEQSLTVFPVSLTPEDSIPFPTGADIRAVVPIAGLRVSELLAHFKGQINSDARKAKFIKLMKENTRFERIRKLLLPLED